MDFAELYLYGSDVVKRIYTLYAGPKDDQFLKRAKIYFKRISIFLMIDSFTNNKVKFEFAKKYFEKTMRI